jgi:hypothetical protein
MLRPGDRLACCATAESEEIENERGGVQREHANVREGAVCSLATSVHRAGMAGAEPTGHGRPTSAPLPIPKE